MKMLRLASFALFVVLATVAACATKEVLLPISGVAPNGVDFSGTWTIREHESAGRRSINRAASQVAKPTKRSSSGHGRGSGLVQVFLETGRTLKITQNQYAFFVSINRSVVEEFQFGESRMIHIGEIEAQRVSGWDGPVYMVQTLDANGMKLIDRFWLSDDRNMLIRAITFRGRNDKTATVTQFFDRTDR
jgi:hypothetical protein